MVKKEMQGQTGPLRAVRMRWFNMLQVFISGWFPPALRGNDLEGAAAVRL